MGSSRKDSAFTVLTTVASIFLRNRALVQSAWAEYTKEERLTVKSLSCNLQSKIHQQRVPRSKMILVHKRESIRKCREICEWVMAKYITILLRSVGYLGYFPDDSLSMINFVCSVQRYLVCKVFFRGTKEGSQHYYLKAHILEKRN